MEYYTFLLNSTVHSTTQGILLEVESASVITGKRCWRCENSKDKNAEQLEVMSREQSMRKSGWRCARGKRGQVSKVGRGRDGMTTTEHATSPANWVLLTGVYLLSNTYGELPLILEMDDEQPQKHPWAILLFLNIAIFSRYFNMMQYIAILSRYFSSVK